MARTPARASYTRRPLASLGAAVTLAAWRWRSQAFLLLIAGFGITTAIVLVCALPLFSNVTATASLRGDLRAQSNNAQMIATVNIEGISSMLVADASAQVDAMIKHDTASYFPGTPQTSLLTGTWSLPSGGFTMNLYGVPSRTAQTHLQLLQGHMPSDDSVSSSSIDVMITQTVANALKNVHVGTSLPLTALLLTGPPASFAADKSLTSYIDTITAHIVGIFQTNSGDAYWNGFTFQAPALVSKTTPPPFVGLVSRPALLALLDRIAQQHRASGIFFGNQTQNAVLLSYIIDPANIASTTLNDLIDHLGKLQQHVYQTFIPHSVPTGASSNIALVDLSGPTLHNSEAPSLLENFRSQQAIMQTPTLILTIQIVCLILFFISIVIGALVEREQPSIAVLRSRGASLRQVFGSLLTQSLALCLFAILVGPLLATGLVYLVAPHMLTNTTQDAINVLTLDPWQAIHTFNSYLLVTIAAIVLTLLLTVSLAARLNILTQRREEARSTRVSLWQRLRLDLVLAVLAIAGYLLTLSLQSKQAFLSAQSQTLVSTPLQLLAPLLLLLAAILLFLRLFPLLLQWLTRPARRYSGLSPLLALTQMARTPYQPMRMALLLGLAIAFTFFSLIFSASQAQRARDLAAYQTASDFSGQTLSLPGTTPFDTAAILREATTLYDHINGVTSATLGYTGDRYLTLNNDTSQVYTRKTILSAVDADTFAQTAIWSEQDSTQPLSDLMIQLIEGRSLALRQGVVPAIVATSTWQLLGLTTGSTFHLADDFGDPDPTTYIAVAEVDHIPPVDDNIHGALLVDYQSLVIGRARYQQATQLNYFWLRTSDNPAALKNVRAALDDPFFGLVSLADRRALSSAYASDPLANNLLSTLGIGVAAALLLALLANLLLPLFSVYTRQTSFAVLRALGTTPRQVTSVLSWELAIILTTALLLGLLFGALLAFTAVPPLIFTGVLSTSLTSTSNAALYTLQHIIPVTVVIPASLLIALAALLLLSLLSLALMTRLMQRPLLAQALLLDQD